MLKNWDWKHTALSLCGLGAMICLYEADQAKAGQALPFHLSAATLTLAVMVFGYVSKQLGGGPASKGGGGSGSAVVTAVGVMALVALTGCLSDAPIVPVTPANTTQISSCQGTAALHNDFVIGDFVIGGSVSGLGTAAAAVADSNASLKTALAITSAGLGAVGIVGTAITGLTASAFSNDQCSSVVGALPTAAPPASQAPAAGR
jgi:hypothetical protein